MSENLQEQIKLLLEKVDRILSILELQSAKQKNRAAGQRSKRTAPLSQEDIAPYQARFESLFETWDSGEELQVEKELNAMEADELRRFADANNLNVTSKTPKQKVLHLIAGRFRERRQLMRSHFGRANPLKSQ